MAGVSFDACALEIWSALLSGSTLYMVDQETKLSPEALLNVYVTHGITHVFVPPALVPALVAAEQPPLLALRYMLVGGDRLPPLPVDHLCYVIVNQYGPTESTVMVTDYRLSGDEQGPPPVGRPLANTRVWVLDQWLQPVPLGVEGEIYIGGAQLARGYWNNEALTSEKFITHEELGRLYRSGDRGYWNGAGELCYRGRTDGQVKLRGYRIELGEVEAALQRVIGVGQAVVLLTGEGVEQQLIGCYTPAEGVAVEASAVLTRLQQLLPGYMVPARLLQLEELPLTLNGKVDRQALALLCQQETESDNLSIQPPSNKIEEALCQVYEQVLQRESVGRNQSFFDLGGDSIKAILLINKLRPLGYTVQVGDVLRYPVVQDLALKTEALVANEKKPESGIEGNVPLTAIQQWFLDGPLQNKDHYNQSVLLHSTERIDSEALKAALDALVRHHDVLRMSFVRTDSGSWQQHNRPASAAAYELQIKELEDAEMVPGFCTAIQTSLHLANGPLLKAAIMRLPDGDRLLLVIHHLVVDGVSWRILLEDLSTAYLQTRAGNAIALPPKTDSFKLWSERLHAYVQNGSLAGEQDYWQEVESDQAQLPLDKPGGSHLLADSHTISFELTAVQTAALQGSAHRAYSTQINELLLAGLSLALGKVFGDGLATIQLEGHGREAALIDEAADISRTVGWFTTTYPVVIERIAAGDTGTLLTTVIGMKEKLRAIPNKGMGYGLLRYLSGKEAAPHTGRADITFNYLGDFGEVVNNEGEQVFQYAKEDRGAELDATAASETALGISGHTSSGILYMNISYSPAQYREETIRQLLDAYQASLSSIANLLPQQLAGQRTPSDLTYKSLNLDEIRHLEKYGRLEDVYPLSPLQEGIYFHWLSEPGSTAYINQTAYRVRGRLDVDLLRQSYERLVRRHGILRTLFTHEHGTSSLQCVYSDHPGHFRLVKSIGDAEIFAESFKERDRDEGFDLGRISQMRLSVIRLNEHLHEFVWTHHHILMDGWCGSILINEFYAIYLSLTAQRPLALPDPMPYVNYIRWLSALRPQQGIAFWKNYLDGYDTAASLPQKSRQPGSSFYRLEQSAFELDASETASLKALCQELAITESSFVQAAWGYLLGRYNNTGDVVFGAVVSGRPAELPGVDTAIGLFINTIPVRVRYEAQATVRNLLQQVQQQAIEALPHHYLQLNDVQAQSLPGNKLFDHILVYENYWVQDATPAAAETPAAMASDATAGLEFLSSDTVEQTDYDFNIMASAGAGRLSVRFSYNGEQYAKKWIEAVSGHFRQMLLVFLQEPNRQLSTINYLGIEETNLLRRFNATTIAYPQDRTIIDLFCEQACLQPSAPALVFGDETLTYRQLNERSNRLAHHLLEQGVGAGATVPVCLGRNPSLVVALLAVLKTGAAYVPIDPQYPAARIAYMLHDSQATMVVTDSRLANLFEGSDTQRVELDGEEARIDMQPAHRPTVATGTGQLAYIIYTSGSTGQPKGVMISHRNVFNFIEWCLDEFCNDAFDVLFAVTSICFDLSVFELFYPLAAGKKIRLIAEAFSLQEELGKESRVLLNVVPSLVRSLLENKADLSPVCSLNMAGEPISADIIEALDLETIRVRNLYGPTEATTYSTCSQLRKDRPVSIGRPVANTGAWILDRYLQPMPIGVGGEIYLEGAQLAHGYWNRQDLTQEKFIPHPFNTNERLYRTGDAGYWNEEGELYYGGRIDNQVKLRGYRIEPGEIEAVLQKLPGVRQAAVVAVGEGASLQLCGFYAADESLPAAFISTSLQAVLPSYMVPARLEQLDELPLTVNGKTDRKALAELHRQRQLHQRDTIAADETYEQPQGRKEEVLCRVYGQVLQLPSVGRNQSFFDLGGDSIKAILLINRLRQHGYSVQVNEILRYPAVSELAPRIKLLEAAHIAEEVAAVEGEVGLTAIQSWFLKASPRTNKQHYNQSVLLYSAQQIDIHALEQALTAIGRHHDALRMVFERLPGGNWRQYNRPPSVPAYELVVTEFNDIAAMSELCTKMQASFQLDMGPLLKAGVMRLPDGDRLLVVAHHLVVDGVSWRILLEDLSTAYLQAISGAPVLLPAKSDSFLQWSAKVYDYVRSARARQQLPYWQEVVRNAGGEGSGLPLDIPNGRHLLSESRMLSFNLTAEETVALQGPIHRAFATQINDVLLAALGMALGKTFGPGKAVIQMEGHGREAAVVSEDLDINRTVGWFTSMYPIVIDRTIPSGRRDLTGALTGIKAIFGALPNKGFDYDLLRYLDAETAAQIDNVPADITFNYLGDFGSSVNSEDGEQVFQYSNDYHGNEVDGNTEVDCSLLVNGYTMSGIFHFNIVFTPAQFHEHTIGTLRDHYHEILSELIGVLADADTSARGLNDEELKMLEHNISAEDLFALSYNQQNYYRDGHFIHAHGSFDLYIRDFDEPTFLSAFERMLANHAILRVRFLQTDNGLRQSFGLPADHRNAIYFYDAGEAPDEAAVQEFFHELARQHFDLLNGETLRCGIVRGGGHAYIQVTIHHIVTDGYSNNILRDLLLSYYQQQPARKVAPYSSFITAQQKYLQSAQGRSGMDYWNSKLFSLGSAMRRPASQAVLERRVVDGMLHAEVVAFCKENNLLLSSFMLAVYYRLLKSRPYANDPILLQVVTNGREANLPGFDIDDSVGQFVSRLPLVLSSPGNIAPGELVRYIQEEYLNGRANQQVPNVAIENEFVKKSNMRLEEMTDQLVNLLDYRNVPFARDAYREERVTLPDEALIPMVGCAFFEDALVIEWVADGNEEAQLFDIIRALTRPAYQAEGLQQ